MNEKRSFDKYLKAFYSDGYRIGMNTTENMNSKKILFSAIEDMYWQIDELISSVTKLAKQEKKLIHCKKGCQWCCYQPVFALNYELDYLNNFIKSNFQTKKQKDIRAKARSKVKKLKGLESDELLNSKHPCALLEEDVCLAYIARPVACRIYISTDVKTCLKFYSVPNDKTNYPALLDFPMQAGRMMNEGFKSALKATGFNLKEFRIEEKLVD